MSKTIKVIDLLNKIANGEIKEGQRFNIKFGDMYRECYFTTDEDKEYCGGLDFFKNCSDNYSVYDCLTLNEEVEIIEEEPEIDIQGIKELETISELKSVCTKVSREENLKRIDKAEVDYFYKINNLVKQQNKIVRAIKQLDNQINNK